MSSCSIPEHTFEKKIRPYSIEKMLCYAYVNKWSPSRVEKLYMVNMKLLITIN